MSLFGIRDLDDLLGNWLDVASLLALSRTNRYYWHRISSSRDYLQTKIIKLKYPRDAFYHAAKQGYTKAALFFWPRYENRHRDLSHLCRQIKLDLFLILYAQRPNQFKLKECLQEACQYNEVEIIQHLFILYSAEQPDLDLRYYFRLACCFGRVETAKFFYRVLKQQQGLPLTLTHPEEIQRALGNWCMSPDLLPWLNQQMKADWEEGKRLEALSQLFAGLSRRDSDQADDYQQFYETGWIPPNETNYVLYCWAHQEADKLAAYLTQWPEAGRSFFCYPGLRFQEAWRARHLSLISLMYRFFRPQCRPLLEIKILQAKLKGTLAQRRWMVDLYNS